jgi:hypothetical protein
MLPKNSPRFKRSIVFRVILGISPPQVAVLNGLSDLPPVLIQ